MTLPYNNYKNQSIQLANLKLAKLPQKIFVDSVELVIKSEFHITLVAAYRLAEIIDSKNKAKIRDEITKEFYKFVKQNPLTKYKLSDELRLVKNQDQMTVVVMAKIESLNNFFHKLNDKFRVALPVQPTHMTLYTLPTDKIGIPINSYEELRQISKIINLPELKSLQRVYNKY